VQYASELAAKLREALRSRSLLETSTDHNMTDEPKSPPSILQDIQARTGLSPKVLLPDSDSEHGASPLVDPNATSAKLMPQGRGNYQLMGEIARGGMSVILKGHDTDLGRDVAVKVLDDELAKRPEVVQRFVEEAQIGGQLQHPGIVPVYELGLMDDDRPYFTMKLIKGRTLASLFQARKTPAENRGRLLAVFEAVCHTVAYAHSKGVVHRDLKPANIMVGAFSEVQVVDWGLAKVLGRGGVADEKRAQETRASLLTVIETVRSGPGSTGTDSLIGSVMGTPAYMAPEQAQGEIDKLDERVDVFSLGAILCELLTGAPPYEDAEGREKVIVQAARAMLDPARERIEASGADPALIRICLDCLTPARAARPANADEVAKAIHAYLISTEERAQKAELEAVEARIKAEQERRGRRLTLALGAAIVLVLLVGGGSYFWIQQTQSQQREQTRIAVDEAHGESIKLLQAGHPEQALAAAQRALALAEAGLTSDQLIERAKQFVTQAEQDAAAARLEGELLSQDQVLVERLIDLRLTVADAVMDDSIKRQLDQEFVQAFQDYGVDLEGADLVPALERIRERDIAEEVALSLDSWSRLRRAIHGEDSLESENLFFLAMDLDDDPTRMEMREAIAARDKDTLIELSRREVLETLSPASIFVLASAIWSMFPEERAEVYRIYDIALPLHPDDYVLQSIGGNLYRGVGRFHASLACRFAALSQRPDDLRARRAVAGSLLFIGHLQDCLNAADACLKQDPNDAETLYTKSMALLQLGHHEEALRTIELSLAQSEDANRRADELVNRYFLGLESLEEVRRQARASRDELVIATLAFALVEHPDPAQRDAPLVLELLEQNSMLFRETSWLWLLETLAYMQLEDWEAARASMSGQYEPVQIAFFVPPVYSSVRATVYAKVGEANIAREAYERGLAESRELTGANETGWGRSDIVRWRARAAAAIGI
jgi:serine/threonine protein kinase/predicted negative regulator of RcsB-dependent stress response